MSKNGNNPILRIYVGQHCWSCEEALRLAEELRSKFGALHVDVIDLDAVGSVNVDDVFSTPTYVFNGRTISLGNPKRDELFAQLGEFLSKEVGGQAC